MKQPYDLVVVMPIGPNCDLDFVMDSITSVRFYCRCSCKFILLDDSNIGLGNKLNEKFKDADVIVNKKSYGLAGGLYISLAVAYKYAIDNYGFKSLLKLDTDALVTGFNPQSAAENLFKKNPKIGIAGLHKQGTDAYSFDTHLDNKWPREHLMRATCTWRIIKRPLGNLALRKYFFLALANGYELGENVFGGAYFMSQSLLQKLSDFNLLPDYRLQNSRLEEDHLFSLLAKVVNFDLGDLAENNLPFACSWKTLPASPEELHKKGKKIIHSTRSWGDRKEKEIRSYFEDIRKMESVAQSPLSSD
jgi:hypothetical protein